MNQSIGEWMSNGLQSFHPSKEIVLRGLRHITEKTRQDLFSNNWHTKQNAVGQLYEAIIYERVLDLTRADIGYALIKKGNDVWWRNRARPKLGQDGLFYDHNGATVVRGNGQDLGEFDLLLTNLQGEIAFAEVIISGNNIRELEDEVEYKRRLLKHLFSERVEFVLITCSEIQNKIVVKRIASKPRSYLAITGGLDELLSNLKREDISKPTPNPSHGSRSVLLSSLKQNEIKYSELHNRCRDEIVNAVIRGAPVFFEEDSWLIKRLVLGSLSEASKRSLLEDKNIVVKKERLNSDNSSGFSRFVLALRMPELRPEVYIKVLQKPVYLKMGPLTTSTFEFERNIRRSRTAFFDWLENVQPEIGPDLMNNILNRYLKDNVVRSRRKLGESPEIN